MVAPASRERLGLNQDLLRADADWLIEAMLQFAALISH
jgi:hypothetical protein